MARRPKKPKVQGAYKPKKTYAKHYASNLGVSKVRANAK